MGAAAVLPSLLSLLLVIAAAAGAEDAMIRPADAAGNNNKVLGETLCCSNMTGFHECVVACFDFYPEDGDKFCDTGCKEAYQCHTVTGDECPSGDRSSSSHDSSSKGSADVDHCISGCHSSVCNKMITATGVGRKGVVKHAVQRCNNACYKFCTMQGGVRAGTSTA